MALLTNGYYPERYWAENYYADDYWPDYGAASPSIPSTLLTPGYWQSTYFPKGYWQDDFWTDYGKISEVSTFLLTPGYWQSTYFPKGNWSDDYWQDYGSAVPKPSGRSTVEIPFRKIAPVHHKYFSYVTFNLFVSAVSRLDRREIELLTSYQFIPAQLLRKIDDLLLIDEDLWLVEN